MANRKYSQLLAVVLMSMAICNGYAKRTTTMRPQKFSDEEWYGGGNPNASYLPALETYLYHGPSGSNDSEYYYDTTVRPALFSTLDIYAEFYLLGIGDVDEKKGTVRPTGIMMLEWRDERLTWNPEDFGNISVAIFDGYKVWIPRFLHDGVKYFPRSEAVIDVEVYHTGNVSMVMSINEQTPCRFDMTNFPRDTQMCSLHLIVADPLVKLHPLSYGNIGEPEPQHEEEMEIHHVAWEVKEVALETASEEAGHTELGFLTISVTMKRYSSFFLRIYVTPVCFLLLLIPVIFLLPPDSTEKLTYGAVLLFSMIYVSQTVEAIYPPYTETMPYLIKLTTASGALLFICILLTSIISSIERIGRKRSLPLWMKKHIVGTIGPFLLVKENADGSSHGTVHIKPTEDNDKSFIVQSEQSIDYVENHVGGESSQGADVNQTLQSLVNEMKYCRLQNRAHEDWTNLFTIINRFLFLLTTLIGIIIISCFA